MLRPARLGDDCTGSGNRRITSRDVDPARRRVFIEGKRSSVLGDWTKASGYEYYRIDHRVITHRCFVNGLPMAVLGSYDTDNHRVVEAAVRTFVT